jgi:hypothetical protein
MGQQRDGGIQARCHRHHRDAQVIANALMATPLLVAPNSVAIAPHLTPSYDVQT